MGTQLQVADVDAENLIDSFLSLGMGKKKEKTKMKLKRKRREGGREGKEQEGQGSEHASGKTERFLSRFFLFRLPSSFLFFALTYHNIFMILFPLYSYGAIGGGAKELRGDALRFPSTPSASVLELHIGKHDYEEDGPRHHKVESSLIPQHLLLLQSAIQ